MRQRRTVVVLILAFLIGFVGLRQLQGQDRSDFTALQTTVKQDDKLTVTIDGGSTVTGRLLEISEERIVLKMKNGPLTIAVPKINLVQRRKNGVLLGAFIGAGAMVPVAIAIGEYSYNEGGSSAYAVVPILAGAGIGMAIDALIPSRQTLYRRTSQNHIGVSPVINRNGVGARIAFKF